MFEIASPPDHGSGDSPLPATLCAGIGIHAICPRIRHCRDDIKGYQGWRWQVIDMDLAKLFPRLLDLLALKGCTIDTMGCRIKIAEPIIDIGADDVLALKGNQSTLVEEVEEAFFDADAELKRCGAGRAIAASSMCFSPSNWKPSR